MTDYTKATDFAAKDALITGNPAKVIKGVDINTEFTAIQTAIATKYDSADLGVSGGSALVGHLSAGTDAVATTVQAVLRRRFIDADDFISTANTAAQNVAGWTALYTYVNGLTNGAHVQVSRGTYLFNASIAMCKKMLLVGEGKDSTIFSFSNTGDGITSTWPINSSTAVYIGVRDLAIFNTNVLNTGGGFVDVGGTFVDLYSCYISGFKYGVVFDQTEIATIDNCIVESSLASGALIWLVDGADHTVGALTGYTNRITITRNQFNSGASVPWQLVIDGGGAHAVNSNNFNAGLNGIRVANSTALEFKNNESETHNTYPMLLTDTKLSGTYVGPVLAPTIESNSFTDIGQGHIYPDAVVGGSIRNNTFNQATIGSIYLINDTTNKCIGMTIEGNAKTVVGTYKQAAPFVYGNTVAIRRNVIKQTANTYSLATASVGANTIAMASVEFISVGAKLWCINTDGTNGEVVTVTAVSGANITATFVSTKATNFLVFAATPDDQYAGGVWTPGIFGSSPVGGATMSVQTGSYAVRGAQCTVNATVTWSALTGGAAGQLMVNLPVVPRISNQLIQCQVSGPTAVGNTNLFFLTQAGTSSAQCVYINSGTGALAGSVIGATGTLYLSGAYGV